MNRKQKLAIGLGGLVGIGILLSRKPSSQPPPPTGVTKFTIGIVNMPSSADRWSCAFQDTTTGIWYQRSNLPFPPPPSAGLLSPTDIAPFSVPVSAGILSISAAAGTGSSADSGITVPTVIAMYQINISVIDGGTYTFNFSTQIFS